MTEKIQRKKSKIEFNYEPDYSKIDDELIEIQKKNDRYFRALKKSRTLDNNVLYTKFTF